jgi:hypothetical protein
MVSLICISLKIALPAPDHVFLLRSWLSSPPTSDRDFLFQWRLRSSTMTSFPRYRALLILISPSLTETQRKLLYNQNTFSSTCSELSLISISFIPVHLIHFSARTTFLKWYSERLELVLTFSWWYSQHPTESVLNI